MSYTGISQMVQSNSLRERIVACVASEGITNPENWATSNIWQICAAITDTDWSYAVENYTINQNPDTGVRTDVVSDQAILSAVQAVQAMP